MARPLAITFLGHATVLVEVDTVRILTDPVLRGRIGPLRRDASMPPPAPPADVDAVLISHLHYDHLDLPSLRRLGRERRIIVPRGAAAWLRGRGFTEVEELGVGGRATVGGVGIRAVYARHGGFRLPAGPSAGALGYLVEGTQSVYFAGDTGLFEGMRELRGAVDVALLPVGGWGPTLPAHHHMNPTDAAHAVAHIQPRITVPIHWGTYWPAGLRWLRPSLRHGPPSRLVRAASELAPGAIIRPTEIGAEVDLR